jgi:hypothetical protein
MAQDKLELEPGQIVIRHIKKVAKPAGWTTDGNSSTYRWLGAYYKAEPLEGINGPQGWQSGWFEPALNEEGSWEMTLPNAAGSDGVLHRDRFLCFRPTVSGDKYRSGDEFFEIYRTQGAGVPAGDPLFVGIVTGATRSISTITLTGKDPLGLAKKWRETAAGFWRHAPRDVFEHYVRAPVPVVSDDFETTGRFTYAGTDADSADGLWTYRNAEDDAANPETVRLRHPGVSTKAGFRSKATLTEGDIARWRFEATIRRDTFTSGGSFLQLSVGRFTTSDNTLFGGGVWIGYDLLDQFGEVSCNSNRGGAATTKYARTAIPRPNTPTRYAIERRDDWIFFYINEFLTAVMPAIRGTDWNSFVGTATPQCSARLITSTDASQATLQSNVYNLLIREWQSAFQRGGIQGDMSLPGVLPVGGLAGSFYDDTTLLTEFGSTNFWRHSMSPNQKPINPQAREDQKQGALGGTFNTFSPVPLPGGAYGSARWTGSIYLDLANYDYALRVRCDDAARVWIGDTRYGREYIYDWTAGHSLATTTGAWLKSGAAGTGAVGAGTSGQLYGQGAGWYPIVVEYRGGAIPTNEFILEYERSDAAGTWNQVGDYTYPNYGSPTTSRVQLSPLGIYQGNPRFDTHRAQLDELIKTYALQFIFEPKRLESGLFPGNLAPRKRVGRDTGVEITAQNAGDIQSTTQAEDSIDTLLLDAAGLADPNGVTQLTVEAMDFTQLALGRHPFVSSEQDSISDITIRALAEQRARSLVLLRSEPWEELAAKPTGRRSFIDSWRLPNTASEFSWSPGDGVLVNLPEIGIVDTSPRPIVGVRWGIVPAGLSQPDARFRQRPRGFRQVLAEALRSSKVTARNYQGQLAIVTGSFAITGGDVYTRMPMPWDVNTIVKVELVVVNKTPGDTSTWTIEVNGTNTGKTFTTLGRYDITNFAARSGSGTELRMYTRCLGGTGATEYHTEMTVRV